MTAPPATDRLMPGERRLWSGVPSRGRKPTRLQWQMALVCSLTATALVALVWHLSVAKADVQGARVLIRGVVAMAALVGGATLLGTTGALIVARRHDSAALYLITDKRALVVIPRNRFWAGLGPAQPAPLSTLSLWNETDQPRAPGPDPTRFTRLRDRPTALAALHLSRREVK